MSRAVVRSGDTSILEEPGTDCRAFSFHQCSGRGDLRSHFSSAALLTGYFSPTLSYFRFVFLLADVGVIQIEPRFVWPFIAVGTLFEDHGKRRFDTRSPSVLAV
jgi:hypothetical protein